MRMVRLFLRRRFQNIARIRLTIVMLGLSMLLSAVLSTIGNNVYTGIILLVEPTELQKIVFADKTVSSKYETIAELYKEHDIAYYTLKTSDGYRIPDIGDVKKTERMPEIIKWDVNLDKDKDALVKGYLIKCLDAEDIMEVSKILEVSGYVVSSSANDVIKMLDYAKVITVSILFVSLLVLIFTATILFFSLRSSHDDELEFVAMLKAIGFTKRKYGIMVITEAVIPTTGGMLLTLLFYLPMMKILKIIMSWQQVKDIFGIEVEMIMRKRPEWVAIVIGIALLEMIIVTFIFVKKSDQKEVYCLLSEANNE